MLAWVGSDMEPLGQEKSEQCPKSEINAQASRKPLHPIALMITHADTAAKTATTVGVGAAGTSYTYLGLPMADLVGLVTIVYLLCQIAALAPKAYAALHSLLCHRRT